MYSLHAKSPPQQGNGPRPPPPLQRADSRPAFQPGAPVGPEQFAPRLGPPRAPLPRPPPPLARPSGPQSFAPLQTPRPPGPVPQPPPARAAPPQQNLQFGPRQPQPPGPPLRVAPPPRHPPPGPRPPAQAPPAGPRATLDELDASAGKPTFAPSENGFEPGGVAKGRSLSIAAAPGAPPPLRPDDERRKSMSVIGARPDEPVARGPNLALIQEGKPGSLSSIPSKESVVRGSNESVRSDVLNESDTADRPDSRVSGSKMTESFIGSLDGGTGIHRNDSTERVAASPISRGRPDDDEDVVIQNHTTPAINNKQSLPLQNEPLQKTPSKSPEIFDRSPSLNQSDSSPDTKVESTKPLVSEIRTGISPRPPSAASSGQKTPEPQHRPAEVSRPHSHINNDRNSIKTESPVMKAPSPALVVNKPPTPAKKKPTEFNTPINSIHSEEAQMRTPRKTTSAPRARGRDGDNDSGVDESTQGNDVNGSPASPGKKSPSKIPASKPATLSRSSSKSATAKTPDPLPAEKKKVPMNKVQVGSTPSPNIKAVKSKIGSLDNSAYKPGGGKIRIESRKLDFQNVTPRIAAKNDAYTPGGGAKKITQTKLQWNAKSKIGSLENTTHKPGGGDKKIETVKLDFKDKAKPKVASTANITHKAGGGTVKIENQKLDIKAQSKVGSLDNVKHKPGGGDIKIFDDKDYLKQTGGAPASLNHSRQEAYGYMSVQDASELDLYERPRSRCKSARYKPRSPSPKKLICERDATIDHFIAMKNEKNLRSTSRPKSAREPPSAAARRCSVVRSSYNSPRKVQQQDNKKPAFIF